MTDDYHQIVREEVRRWEARGPSILSKLSETILVPAQKAAEALIPPRLQEEVSQILAQVIHSLQDISYHLVDEERLNGEVFLESQRHAWPLKASDTVARRCWAWNLAYVGTEGALTGLVGWGGLLVDIPALYTLSLRTLQEIATCYGYDVSSDTEQQYIYQLLSLGASATFERKFGLLLEIKKLELALLKDAAVRMACEMAQRQAARAAVNEVAYAVGAGLARRQSLQLLPLIGAIFGASANAYFLHDLAETAYMCYRRRRLAELLSGQLND